MRLIKEHGNDMKAICEKMVGRTISGCYSYKFKLYKLAKEGVVKVEPEVLALITPGRPTAQMWS